MQQAQVVDSIIIIGFVSWFIALSLLYNATSSTESYRVYNIDWVCQLVYNTEFIV